MLNQVQVCIGTILLILSALSHANEIDGEKMRELTELADSGDVNAQRQLASAYDYGFYGIRDGELAMKYYAMAANQGDAEAQNSMGSGLQAEGKFAEAFAWYERAARQNHGLGINNLAHLYDSGLGVPQDRQQALKLYTRAAELGRADAMWNIANMYGAGQLGVRDYFRACVWIVRAMNYSTGSYFTGEYDEYQALFREGLQYVAKSLSPEGLKECNLEAKEWSPTYTEATPTG